MSLLMDNTWRAYQAASHLARIGQTRTQLLLDTFFNLGHICYRVDVENAEVILQDVHSFCSQFIQICEQLLFL